jgi:hypothetical protein
LVGWDGKQNQIIHIIESKESGFIIWSKSVPLVQYADFSVNHITLTLLNCPVNDSLLVAIRNLDKSIAEIAVDGSRNINKRFLPWVSLIPSSMGFSGQYTI